MHLWLAVVLTVLPPVTASAETDRHGFEVVRAYPHDPRAFTQGLFYLGGWFYEGTGRHGQSSLRRVEPETGRTVRRVDLAPHLFGEGIAALGDRIYQLTWRAGIGLVFDKLSFKLLDQFTYPGEGWGLTSDGVHLIMSDGTDRLRFLDPNTLSAVRELRVREGGRPVRFLNELEFIRGEIWANVWRTNTIVRIAPDDGRVTGIVDIDGILEPTPPEIRGANGIAYDAARDRVFVTGKLWPTIFEIRLTPP